MNLVFTKENGICNGTDITRYPFKIIHDELGMDLLRKNGFHNCNSNHCILINLFMKSITEIPV